MMGLLTLPAAAAVLEAPGVPNFHQVSDRVYRGGQPTGSGWQSLSKLGVKTVVDLRLQTEHDTRAEAAAVQAAGMKYVNIPMHGVVSPSDEEVQKVLALFESTSAGPVFVHCRRGADRTGTVVGCYRILHDHWGNEQAFKEAKSLGMSWTQIGLKHYLLKFRPDTLVAGAPAVLPAAITPAGN